MLPPDVVSRLRLIKENKSVLHHNYVFPELDARSSAHGITALQTTPATAPMQLTCFTRQWTTKNALLGGRFCDILFRLFDYQDLSGLEIIGAQIVISLQLGNRRVIG